MIENRIRDSTNGAQGEISGDVLGPIVHLRSCEFSRSSTEIWKWFHIIVTIHGESHRACSHFFDLFRRHELQRNPKHREGIIKYLMLNLKLFRYALNHVEAEEQIFVQNVALRLRSFHGRRSHY
jgi:hypothetical protein